MFTTITEHQKQIIKELVDEIIVNRGILKVRQHLNNVDGMKADELHRQAFRYYKMIMRGESPLDIDRHHEHKFPVKDSQTAILPNSCIGCNQSLSENDIKSNMPVCVACRAKVKVDYEILRELFH